MSQWKTPDAFGAVVAPDQGIHEYVETAKHRLGSHYDVGPRRFRYAKLGDASTRAGQVYSAKVVSTDNYDDCTLQTAAAVGDAVLNVTLPSVAGITAPANTWDDGWVYVINASTAAAKGTTYTIKSHTTTSSTAGSIALTLYEPIASAVAISQTVCMAPNPYNSVQLSTNADVTAGYAVGGCQALCTANYHGWLQVRGPGPIHVGAAGIAEKTMLCLDATTAGAVISLAITSQATAIPTFVARAYYEPGGAGTTAWAWYTLD